MDANIRKHWNDPVCIQRVLFILVITLIGTFIYAAGLNIFLVPHHFLAGGVTGIAMILYYLMDIPIGLSNLVLNIPVLILSLKFMGKFYTVVTILSTVSLSLFIDLTAFMADWCVISNPLVAAISGGVVLGAALGLLYRYNSNSGGLDVIGAVIKKFYNLEIGYVVFGLNFIIIMSSAWIFTLEPAICTLIAMYINATVSSRIVIGFAQRKAAFIVSDKPLEVADTILRNIHHGATLLYGQGGFSGKRQENRLRYRGSDASHQAASFYRGHRPPRLPFHHEHHRRHRPRLHQPPHAEAPRHHQVHLRC